MWKFEDFIISAPNLDVETLASLHQRDYRVAVKRKVLYKVLARVRHKIKVEHTMCFEFVRKYYVMV